MVNQHAFHAFQPTKIQIQAIIQNNLLWANNLCGRMDWRTCWNMMESTDLEDWLVREHYTLLHVPVTHSTQATSFHASCIINFNMTGHVTAMTSGLLRVGRRARGKCSRCVWQPLWLKVFGESSRWEPRSETGLRVRQGGPPAWVRCDGKLLNALPCVLWERSKVGAWEKSNLRWDLQMGYSIIRHFSA